MNPLQSLRDSIDNIDNQILNLLSARFECVKEVAQVKKLHNLPAIAPDRWKEVLKTRIEKGQELELKEKFVIDLYNLIHETALEIEDEIIG
jgi:chorismate mutase